MGWDDNKGLKSLCSHRASDGCLGPLYFGENSLRLTRGDGQSYK